MDARITADDLDLEQQVALRHTEELLHEIARGTSHPSILGAIGLLSRVSTVKEFINYGLIIYEVVERSSEASPDIKSTREIIQDIFKETSLTEQLQKLCTAFMNVRKRLEIVRKLESRASAEQKERFQDDTEAPPGSEGAKPGMGEGPRVTDERINDAKRFRKNLEGKKAPPAVQKRFEEELNRYLSMDQSHAESSVIRTYLDYLTSLPWSITTEDRFDTKVAKEILDADHYGLDDIKQRILEFLAVGKLQGKVQGKILCFVGPPGVGKTSIGASIAR